MCMECISIFNLATCFKSEPSNKIEDEREWTQEVSERLIEMQQDAEEAFSKAMDDYERNISQWRTWKEAKVPINDNIYTICTIPKQ